MIFEALTLVRLKNQQPCRPYCLVLVLDDIMNIQRWWRGISRKTWTVHVTLERKAFDYLVREIEVETELEKVFWAA